MGDGILWSATVAGPEGGHLIVRQAAEVEWLEISAESLAAPGVAVSADLPRRALWRVLVPALERSPEYNKVSGKVAGPNGQFVKIWPGETSILRIMVRNRRMDRVEFEFNEAARASLLGFLRNC